MGLRGKTKLFAKLRVAASGEGNALRSTLPLGVKGRESSNTNAWGTI